MRGSAWVTAKLVSARIAGDALRQFEALGEALARLDQIGGQPHGLAFLGRIGAAGQHHVHHARDADQPRQPHRAAAADIDAAAALRQRVIGRALGHAHMRGGGQFQPAADHRAMQHGDHRHLAELDLLEGAVPEPGMGDALGDVVLLEFAEIEAGGEMLALAMQQHGADAVRQRGEEGLDAENGLVVERIALVRTRQPQHGDLALPLGIERGGQSLILSRPTAIIPPR